MASNSETGNAVNLSNFKLMVDRCAGFGAAYNPSNKNLTIPNMTAQWQAGDAAQDVITKAMGAAVTPIAAREKLFSTENILVTRTLNYYGSTEAAAQNVAAAKGIADKIRGFGIKVVKLPNGLPDPAHVSTSHQSYVQRTDAFNELIALYAGDENYAPNENDLTIDALTTYYTSTKAADDNIGTIIQPVEAARVARDAALYAEGTGIIDVSIQCKKYVRGVFGAKSANAKLVTGIRFRRKKKTK